MNAECLFEPGLIDRLQAQYEHVDVRSLAGNVHDMAQRKTVRNPNGLLVRWVRDAAKSKAIAVGTGDRRELDRYAAFHAEIYRRVSAGELGPWDLADELDRARAGEFGRLNPFVSEMLRSLGPKWPEAPVEAACSS